MKLTTPFGVALIFLLGCIGGCAANTQPADLPTTGSIKGVVVDAHNMGVGSTSITLLSAEKKPRPLASTVTDDDGNFILEDLAQGHGLTLTATRRGTRNQINYYGNLAPEQGTTSVRSGLIESGGKTNVTVRAGKVTDVGAIKLTAHAK